MDHSARIAGIKKEQMSRERGYRRAEESSGHEVQESPNYERQEHNREKEAEY